MSTYIVTEHFIGCDGRYCSAATETFRNLRIAQRVAADEGWLISADGVDHDGDFCPACAAERDEENE